MVNTDLYGFIFTLSLCNNGTILESYMEVNLLSISSNVKLEGSLEDVIWFINTGEVRPAILVYLSTFICLPQLRRLVHMMAQIVYTEAGLLSSCKVAKFFLV